MRKRFEPTTLIGLLIGISAIAASMFLDGTKPRFLWQPSALLIVLGGTLGAVTVRSGLSGILDTLKQTLGLFRRPEDEDEDMIARIAWLARTSRREGHRVLERYATASKDKLISTGLSLTCEYIEPQLIAASLDAVLDEEDQIAQKHISVLESAGTYSPTFGILGAVLGLIHVLRALDHPGELGVGIATAFVATIYGVGIANLFFFPLAARLRERHQQRIRRREKIADALVALSANESPMSIERRFAGGK
ncbi:MAG TPA: MotA/TolQ/ExbB proton channel family protein [Pyrinomonadaceae bacterium]